MERQLFELCLGGRSLRYLLRDPAAARYFAMPLLPCRGDSWDVTADDELMRQGRELFPPGINDAVLEYKLLLLPTAQALLRFDACIVHAVAFAWRGLAWLLCGPSGTGKTTQYRRWVELCGEDVQLICGDMSTVSLEPDGSVLISPSPWPGKEGWPGVTQAPLGGVVYLEQSDENTISPMAPTQSVRQMLEYSLCRPDSPDGISSLAALLDRIVSDYPIWLLRNRGDLASARLTMETLDAYLTKGTTQ